MSGIEGMPYIVLVIVSTVLGLASQWYINHSYDKWSKVRMSLNRTGADVARQMLDSNGASAVGITRVAGHLTDYYDPRDNNLHLSDENHSEGSVASVAVACHEAGHACQNASGYLMMRLRSSLVPIVNFTSQTWMFLFMAGILLNLVGLAQIAVALFAVSVLFHIVTLPVEIDASRRAVKYIDTLSMSPEDRRGSRAVLRAAALTYVTSALISVLQLLYYMGRVNRRR